MSQAIFVLSDHYENWINLNPLTLTKPIAHLRIGISTILEKWNGFSNQEVQVKTCAPFLSDFDTWRATEKETYIFINSSLIPTQDLCKKLQSLKNGQSLYQGGKLLASCTTIGDGGFEEEIQYAEKLIQVERPWDIFSLNAEVLAQDFETISKNRRSESLSDSNKLIGPKDQLFIEEGAKVEGAILNTSSGPIYIGSNAEIMEGSVVRGGLALCHNAVLKLSTKIYGATTIGPYCKVGGEVNNSVLQGYSNKGHDGFLGNSVIGEWCNLGADTNTSNLKNNYGEVQVYNYQAEDYIKSGLQFLGLIMGDHSKCGINTMFNTGTVVGVFANIFGSGFPPKYIPSFSWGGSEGFSCYRLDKALEVAKIVMNRRNVSLSKKDESILNYIHESSLKK